MTPLQTALQKLERAEETPCTLTLAEAKAILQKITDLEDAADDAWYERNTRD